MENRLVSMLWKFILCFQILIFDIISLNNNNSLKIIIKNINVQLIDIDSGKPYYSGEREEGEGA